jgi:hypothetical protein
MAENTTGRSVWVVPIVVAIIGAIGAIIAAWIGIGPPGPGSGQPACQYKVSLAGEGPKLGSRGFLSVGGSKVFLGFMTDTNFTKYPWDQAKLDDVVSHATAKGNKLDRGEIQTHIQGKGWYSVSLADKAVVILYVYDQTAQKRSWVAIRWQGDDDVFEFRWSGSDEIRRLNDCSLEDRPLMGDPHVQVSVFNPSDDLPNRLYYKYFIAGASD